MRRLASAAILGLALGITGAVGLCIALTDHAATAAPPTQGPPREGWAPDPPAQTSKKHWVFSIAVDKGNVTIAKVTEVELDKPAATPRVVGRYALELQIGKELLDRLRFNVPLGGDGPHDDDRPGLKRPEFRVTTKFFVRMADAPRATTLRLVDRATGDVRVFAWPPAAGGALVEKTAGTDADAGDGGKPDGGDAGDGGDGGKPDGGDGGKPDGGDGGKPDGGDGGKPDGGKPDAGDAGLPDAWTPDAMPLEP
jgi:hypothetical protein